MLRKSQYAYTAGSSSVTFTAAKKNAVAAGLITDSTKVYAVFFSGLDTYYVEVRATSAHSGDFKISKIPDATADKLAPVGQVYVVLSTANGLGDNKVNDANTISGVGLLEILPHGQRS